LTIVSCTKSSASAALRMYLRAARYSWSTNGNTSRTNRTDGSSIAITVAAESPVPFVMPAAWHLKRT
jgi:hypothetical protein